MFTRAHLLQEVWGYDYFGGTRTVDVHVRRLRAKLGTEHEALIGTVRNVGYRFVPAKGADEGRVPRSSRPEDLEPDVTEANGLPAEEQPRTQPGERRQQSAAGRAQRQAQPGRASRAARRRTGQQETRPKQTRAAPADQR